MKLLLLVFKQPLEARGETGEALNLARDDDLRCLTVGGLFERFERLDLDDLIVGVGVVEELDGVRQRGLHLHDGLETENARTGRQDDDEDEDDEDYEDVDDDYDFGGETLYEVKCPTCGEEITIDEEMLDEGSTTCPNCGEELEFDMEDEEPEEDQ